MTDLNKLRSEFEAWVLQESPQMEWELNLKTDGEYDSAALSWGWAAWQEKAKAQAVPDTHVVVPKVANKKMVNAGYEAHDGFYTNGQVQDVYQAMIKASESGAEG
ncbi:hypothetical protein [Acinetobacter baumannii]|uniref:hypothetical protein n=1 Tax=Acinetobacter baumannii TaxID=470 RepID=UPI001900D606|nr:hypothetical protein [Acinetobacter baumannii]MBJ9771397.1 hypothetical protein [Acinetobacter baumannii]